MYSAHDEGKPVVAERLIRTLKNRIFKYMTSISKNVYYDTLANIVNKYNHIYHSTIKMKPVDVNSSTYIGFGVETMKNILNFKAGDHVRISKYKSIFAKGHPSTPPPSKLVRRSFYS